MKTTTSLPQRGISVLDSGSHNRDPMAGN